MFFALLLVSDSSSGKKKKNRHFSTFYVPSQARYLAVDLPETAFPKLCVGDLMLLLNSIKFSWPRMSGFETSI